MNKSIVVIIVRGKPTWLKTIDTTVPLLHEFHLFWFKSSIRYFLKRLLIKVDLQNKQLKMFAWRVNSRKTNGGNISQKLFYNVSSFSWGMPAFTQKHRSEAYAHMHVKSNAKKMFEDVFMTCTCISKADVRKSAFPLLLLLKRFLDAHGRSLVLCHEGLKFGRSVAQRPRTTIGRAGDGCGRESPPPAKRVRG